VFFIQKIKKRKKVFYIYGYSRLLRFQGQSVETKSLPVLL